MNSFAQRDGHLDHLVAAVGVIRHWPRDDPRDARYGQDAVDPVRGQRADSDERPVGGVPGAVFDRAAA